MNKITAIVILGAGLVLIAFGLTFWDSLSSDFRRLFTSAPADKAVWLLIGGAIAVAFGSFGLVRRPRSL